MKTATNKSFMGKAFGRGLAAWTCALAMIVAAAPGWAAPTVSTSTAVASSANPVVVGDPTTFTATVNGSNPTGLVTFKSGSTTLGTAALDGAGNSRTAAYTATLTPAGSKNITAVYSGDALNIKSTSAVLSQIIGKASPTNALGSSSASSAAGESVTFTATVAGYNPTGNVAFKDGTSTKGTVALSGTGNTRTAIFTTSALAAGSRSITAVYAGDASNTSVTSSAIIQTVSKAAPVATLASSVNPSAAGATVTFIATVTGNNPTGNVAFKDGTATKGTAALSGTGNTRTASISISNLTSGSHSITAVYAGDTLNNAVTSDALVQLVSKAAPVVTLASSLNPSAAGATVTLIATVTGNNPTGNVAFKDGTGTKGTVALSGSGDTRTASFSISTLAAGSHSLTAVYAGNTLNTSATSDALIQTVGAKTVAVTSISSSQNPSAAGSAVIFTASVVGTAPSGTVSFRDGNAVLGASVLSGDGDTRTTSFSVSSLIVGNHNIKAVYVGDSRNATDTSDVLVQRVNAAPATRATTTVLSSNLGTAPVGQNIVLTASVSGTSPTGNVTFKDGAAVLGSSILTGGVATFSANGLALGSHALSAQYAGDANNDPSTSALVTVAINSGSLTWQYSYDAMGRRTTAVDPNGLASYTYYDGLGRPVQTQQPANVGTSTPTITDFSYNSRDDLTRVSDPRNLTTTYVPNALGNVTAQTSPDTGASQYTYDGNGNVLTKTDARGKLTQYAYDRLNRLVSVTYPSGVPSTFEYDGGATPIHAAIGEVTKITDASGQAVYTYDSLGRKVTKAQTTNGKIFTVGYTWGDTGSALDKLIAITYPSGTRVNYSYDAQGVVNAITVNPPNANGTGTNVGSSLSLLSGVTQNAENKVTGWTWASAKAQAISYDANGQISAYNLGDTSSTGTRRTIIRDSAGRITGYTHSTNAVPAPTLDQSFAYDNLNRLTSTTSGSGNTLQYKYDATGNRTAKVVGGNNYANTIAATSNRLNQTQDVTGTASVVHDAAGNTTNDGTNNYTYSDRGRLATTTNAGGSVGYSYNALELRVSKTGPAALVQTGAAYYVYDEEGKLLGEYDANGAPAYETVYMGIPVGVIKQTGTTGGGNIAISLYNLSTDQLGAPRVITRQSDEAIVWRWDDAEAFGATAPDQNPTGIGVFAYNQRLPGQVFDAESGLVQNWYREYNPRIGRYMQSDPIGLAGGVNTFAYVGGNPLSFTDPVGLKCVTANGLTTCQYPDPANGPSFAVPSTPGFPSSLGPGDWFYHNYDISVPINDADRNCILRELQLHATPGDSNGSSAEGTSNDAKVGPFHNPVKSYTTRDRNTGAQLVINMTTRGGVFADGYVARGIAGGNVHTWGEGTSPWQSPYATGFDTQFMANQLVWGVQMKEIVKKCSCEK